MDSSSEENLAQMSDSVGLMHKDDELQKATPKRDSFCGSKGSNSTFGEFTLSSSSEGKKKVFHDSFVAKDFSFLRFLFPCWFPQLNDDEVCSKTYYNTRQSIRELFTDFRKAHQVSTQKRCLMFLLQFVKENKGAIHMLCEGALGLIGQNKFLLFHGVRQAYEPISEVEVWHSDLLFILLDELDSKGVVYQKYWPQLVKELIIILDNAHTKEVEILTLEVIAKIVEADEGQVAAVIWEGTKFRSKLFKIINSKTNPDQQIALSILKFLPSWMVQNKSEFADRFAQSLHVVEYGSTLKEIVYIMQKFMKTHLQEFVAAGCLSRLLYILMVCCQQKDPADLMDPIARLILDFLEQGQHTTTLVVYFKRGAAFRTFCSFIEGRSDWEEAVVVSELLHLIEESICCNTFLK